MEPNNLDGGIFSSINPSLLTVENPLHQQQNPSNPHHNLHQPQMVSYVRHETDQQPLSQTPITTSAMRQVQKSKSQTTLSDEEDPSFAADEDPKRKISQWQRMKWTDMMVRLLITAVYYIGDEAGSEGNNDPAKKKTTGLLQKKGKWKSVSRAMMEKGYYVSPQQCEDKFNDLNKRYKRVNDILGKGTSCKVVENQSLLDTMDLSPKMKEEVRKLLNSKHLFFREMCVYHNSCGHGSSSGAPAHHSPDVGSEPSQVQPPQQRCLHSSENAVANLSRPGTEAMKTLKEDDDGDDDDEEDNHDDDSDDYSDEEEDEDNDGNGHEDADENIDATASKKRSRKTAFSASSPLMQKLSGEVASVFGDGGRSWWEKKQWTKKRLIQLEEQQVSYQIQAFELEKQRLKWIRFSRKKDREMERAKLENERRRLENERMVLVLRHKEIELLNAHAQQQQTQQQQHAQQQQQQVRGDISSVTISG